MTYHNVFHVGSLSGTDQCMHIHEKDGHVSGQATNWAAGQWGDGPCNIQQAAMCEADKVLVFKVIFRVEKLS